MHLINLFNKITNQYPNHIAIKYGIETQSYSELNISSNALAALLAKHNIQSGSRVGLFFIDPLLFINAMLALVKLNAIYVPFDKKDTYQNIADLCSVADVSFFLHDLDFTDPLLFAFSPIKIVRQDLKNREIPLPCILSDYSTNPVLYIMFTSSTTGKAKGVLVNHSGISRFIHENNRVRIVTEDSILQASSISFDASSFEIWASLLNGATLVLVEKDFDFLHLGSYLTQYNISVLWLTTKLFETLLLIDSHIFIKLKYLIFGGEACTFSHIILAFKSLPDVKLINGYGPTENTIFTTFHQVSQKDENRGFIPIGFPVHDTQCYVLDEHLNLVDPGNSGTLFVAGAGVAHSYTDKTLTDINFINHLDLGLWLYNTKDIVRYNPEFGFEYLGRIDRQVKINGYRVELDLIENTVNQLENILHSMAVFIPSKYTDELVLFYTTPNKKALDASDLKTYLERNLPWYSIPKSIHFEEEFPFNKSMKVDQKKLIDGLKKNIETDLLPINEIETIWKEVLQLDFINPDDNFFEIGGDSLASLVLISSVNKILKLQLKVGYIIENSIFQNFCSNLHNKDHSQREIVLLKEGKVDCPIFLIPPLKAGSEIFLSLANALKTKQSIFSFNNQLDENERLQLNESKLAYSIMIEVNFIKKLTQLFSNQIVKSGIYQKIILAGYSFGGNLAIEISHELKKYNIEVAQIHLLDSAKFGHTADSSLKEFTSKGAYFRKIIIYLVEGIIFPKKNQLKRILHFLNQKDEINSQKISDIPVFLYKCLLKSNKLYRYLIKYTKVNFLDSYKFLDPLSLDWQSKIEKLKVIGLYSNHLNMLKVGYVEELANRMDESIDSLLNELYYQSIKFDKLSKVEFDHYLSKGWCRLRFGNHMFTDTKAFFDNKYFPIKWIRYKLDPSFMSKSIKKDRNYKQCKIFTSVFSDFNYENEKDEIESLYSRYRFNIDFDGYKSVYSVVHHGDADGSIFNSKILKLYDKDKLIGVGIFDLGEISGAGTLYYYDHDYARYGISKCLILFILEYLIDLQYHYFYQGFIFIGHPKMNYKLSLEKSGIEYYDQMTDQWLLYDS